MNIQNQNIKKSRYHKQSTKSCNEDNNPEEEELKKYRELIEKLSHLQKNKTKDLSSSPYSDSGLESSHNNLSSNVRRTTSRTKEVFNDRDFLINFMNDDTMPILPKNMHLLTDDDTNQNIDDKTKFKNLADLLLDDKETVIESHFIKKVEDKMILKLYTALSRRAKEVFMEENAVNKDKNRILIHKLNNIKIQKLEFEDKDKPNINENTNLNIHTYDKEEKNEFAEDEFNDENNTILNKILKKKQKNYSPQKESKSNYLDDLDNLISSTNINPMKKNSLIKSQNSALYPYPKEKPHFLPDCKYNKKNKSVKRIKLPTLESYMPLRNNKLNSRKSRKVVLQQQPKLNQWEPDIDCDLLTYINHNIIKIEDIYNKGKENVFELKENQDEEIEPIEAKEVFFDINQSNNNNEDETENVNNKKNSIDNNNQSKKSFTNISEEDETELKTKNKFCEYKDRTPNLIEISLMVEPDKKKLNDFHNELKELYTNRINEIGELDEDMFPSFGNNLRHNKIYKYAMNNERNEEMNTDNFTLLGESTNLDLSKSKRELKLNLMFGNESMKSEENDENDENKINNNENILSNKDSLINKDNNVSNENMNNLTEQKKEEEKNDSQKSRYNILYEDESNNFYSLEDNNKNNNLTNNNNDADNEKSDEYVNNNNDDNESKENNNFNKDDLNMEENNENDDNNNDHFLKISFSKNISN